MHKIRSINLSKLRKLELPDLAERVIKVIENFDPEVLKIKEAYDLLAAQQPQIEILKNEYGPHEITPELKKLRAERQAFVAVIATQARSLSNLEVEGGESGAKLVGLHCNFYLKNFGKLNERDKYQKLSEFFKKIEENEALELACSTMGLTTHLNELKGIHMRLNAKWEMRDSSIAARPKVSIPPITKLVRNAISNVFSQINNAQSQNVDLDYTLLIAELNKKIVHFTTLINSRMTAAEKRKAQEQAEAENGESGEVVVEDGAGGAEGSTEEPESTVMTTPLNYENRDGERLDDNAFLNKEKTAARSSKNTQLPSIEDEA